MDYTAHTSLNSPQDNDPQHRVLTPEEFQKIPELRYNPLRKRIAAVFVNGHDEIGFDEFLDFCSVFSEEATRDVKAVYAFKIFDFNQDGYLDRHDIAHTVRAFVGKTLKPMEVKQVVRKIMEEADLDGGGSLSFVEFEHVLSRSPDFVR